VNQGFAHAPLSRKVIDSLHVEAMVLADEARSYFDGTGLGDRADLDPMTRVIFSCEALKVTTRLMHSVAWLLSQRAYFSGEQSRPVSAAQLGKASRTDPSARAVLPPEALRIIDVSEEIYARIERIDVGQRSADHPMPSPALQLIHTLERAF
jgi:regulator of CtrA degradation